MPNDIAYSRKLGPLTPFVGEWEGDSGVDRSYHNKDDWTTETSYFEKAFFKPIPVQENGQQVLWLLAIASRQDFRPSGDPRSPADPGRLSHSLELT